MLRPFVIESCSTSRIMIIKNYKIATIKQTSDSYSLCCEANQTPLLVWRLNCHRTGHRTSFRFCFRNNTHRCRRLRIFPCIDTTKDATFSEISPDRYIQHVHHYTVSNYRRPLVSTPSPKGIFIALPKSTLKELPEIFWRRG